MARTYLNGSFGILLVISLIAVVDVSWGEAIQLTAVKGLTFTRTNPGAAAEVIAPGASTCSEFSITGQANRAIELELPTGTIDMTNGASTIAVNNWTATLNGASVTGPTVVGALDGTGNATLYLGATRGVVPAGAVSGAYTGSHTVIARYASGGGPTRTRTADHTVVILKSISVAKVSDLLFPPGAAGDSAVTIAAGTIGSASFTVTGEPNQAYNVTLPANGTVTMTTGGGGANRTISVTAFTSSPSGAGTLTAGGTQTLAVGATRAASGVGQVGGVYSGTFSVTVAYP